LEIPIIIQVLGYIVGIIGAVYGIMMRRKLIHFQLKTERAKASYYKSKRKAEEMRKNKYSVEVGKSFSPWICMSAIVLLPQ